MKTITTLLLSLSLMANSLYADDTELAKHMDELSSHLKSLRRFDDTDWSGKAGAVRSAQAELLASFEYTPKLLSEVPEGVEKEKQVIEYKLILAKNLSKLLELEQALLNEDEEAVDDLQRALKKIKKEGHTQFIAD